MGRSDYTRAWGSALKYLCEGVSEQKIINIFLVKFRSFIDLSIFYPVKILCYTVILDANNDVQWC